MSDAEQVSQALAELWDIVKCRCHEAYTGRGLHDPDCQCDSTDAVQTVADRIEALTKERDEAVHLARMRKTFTEEARDERDAAAAKLAKAVEIGNKMAHSIEGNYYLPNIAGEWRKVAAEIKGESHE